MPVLYVDVPPGLDTNKKRTLVGEIYAAVDEAYRVPDTRIFLREWPFDTVSQDGRFDDEPNRPVVFLEVPPDIQHDIKQELVKRVSAAVTDAYHLPDVLIFFREYPLDMVSQDGLLQSENPVILRAMEEAAARGAARVA